MSQILNQIRIFDHQQRPSPKGHGKILVVETYFRFLFMPFFFYLLITLNKWRTKRVFAKYTHTNLRYVFLKSAKHKRKVGPLWLQTNVIIFLDVDLA